MINASIIAITAIRIASERNWVINCLRADPKTFLIPTSFALPADLAVERFMKFTQAISRMKRATAENM